VRGRSHSRQCFDQLLLGASQVADLVGQYVQK